MNANLQRLQVLTDQLEVQEDDFIDYVLRAEYVIILVSPAGRIKWCNDYFYGLFEQNKDDVVNKSVKRVIGTDISNDTDRITLECNGQECEFLIEQSELTRKGKIIHRKITLIPS